MPAQSAKTGRGGYRPGAGSKPKDPANPLDSAILLRLSAAQIARIDRARGSLSRSEFAREAILAALDQAEYRQTPA